MPTTGDDKNLNWARHATASVVVAAAVTLTKENPYDPLLVMWCLQLIDNIESENGDEES
jgi:hypothetical protein